MRGAHVIQELEVSLRAVSAKGPELSPAAFQSALQVTPPLGASTEGPARLILWACDVIQDFASFDDKAEAFAEAAPGALREVAAWLARLSPGALGAVRAQGYAVDLLVDVALDQGALELDVPPELLATLGRLEVPLRLTTRDWEL